MRRGGSRLGEGEPGQAWAQERLWEQKAVGTCHPHVAQGRKEAPGGVNAPPEAGATLAVPCPTPCSVLHSPGVPKAFSPAHRVLGQPGDRARRLHPGPPSPTVCRPIPHPRPPPQDATVLSETVVGSEPTGLASPECLLQLPKLMHELPSPALVLPGRGPGPSEAGGIAPVLTHCPHPCGQPGDMCCPAGTTGNQEHHLQQRF